MICDEPVSALDLSVQADSLNLLRQLRRELDLAYVFIAHDLAVVRHLSRRIIVLYRGRIMERGPTAAVYERPAHPHTQALPAASPVPDPDAQERRRSERAPLTAPSSAPPLPAACPFSPRCPHTVAACTSERPELERTPDGSLVACHRWRELRLTSNLAAAHDALLAPATASP